MKSIICPVSSEKTESHVPRLVALLTSVLLVLLVVTGWWPILVMLMLDFYVRAVGSIKWSYLVLASRGISSILRLRSVLIPLAPKLFAARIGALLITMALLFLLLGWNSASLALLGVLIVFASIECGLNFCVGCYIYTYLVFPFYKKNQLGVN
jgi:hypothetical protein